MLVISFAREKLTEMGYGEARIARLEQDVEAETQAAVKFAEESPEPGPDVLEPTTYDGPFAS